MFIFADLINNEIVKLFLNLFYFFFIFFVLGSFVHSLFKIEKNNVYLYFVTGFLFYFLISFFYYVPLIIFETDMEILVTFEEIKQLLIIIFVLLFNRIWVKKVLLFFNWKSLLYSSISLTLIILVYFAIAINAEGYNDYQSNTSIYVELLKMDNFVSDDFTPYLEENKNYYSIYQIYYYNIVFQANLLLVDIEIILEYMLILQVLILLFFLYKGTILKRENILNYSILIIISLINIFIFGYVTTTSQWFFSIIILNYLIFLFYLSETNYYFNNQYYYIIIMFTFLFFISNYYAIIISFIFLLGIIYYLIYKKQGFIFELELFLILIYLEGMLFFFQKSTLLLILFLIIFSFPIIVLTIFLKRKKNYVEIKRFENYFHNNVDIINLWTVGIILGLASLLLINNHEAYVNLLADYFSKENIWKYLLYFVFAVIIVLIFLYTNGFYKKKKINYIPENKNNIYILGLYVSVIYLNPFIITFFFLIFNFEAFVAGYYFLFIFLLIFIIDEIKKYFQNKLKYNNLYLYRNQIDVYESRYFKKNK